MDARTSLSDRLTARSVRTAAGWETDAGTQEKLLEAASYTDTCPFKGLAPPGDPEGQERPMGTAVILGAACCLGQSHYCLSVFHLQCQWVNPERPPGLPRGRWCHLHPISGGARLTHKRPPGQPRGRGCHNHDRPL